MLKKKKVHITTRLADAAKSMTKVHQARMTGRKLKKSKVKLPYKNSNVHAESGESGFGGDGGY